MAMAHFYRMRELILTNLKIVLLLYTVIMEVQVTLVY